MTKSATTLIPAAALLAALAWPVFAASSAASSASDSVTASVGSLSGSVQGSSNSSTGDRRVAEGEYRIIEVASDQANPEMVRLHLSAAEGPDQERASFFLTLPRQTQLRGGLAEGSIISVFERPYGLEFAEGRPLRAFFLALDDASMRELRIAPVVL